MTIARPDSMPTDPTTSSTFCQHPPPLVRAYFQLWSFWNNFWRWKRIRHSHRHTFESLQCILWSRRGAVLSEATWREPIWPAISDLQAAWAPPPSSVSPWVSPDLRTQSWGSHHRSPHSTCSTWCLRTPPACYMEGPRCFGSFQSLCRLSY